MKVSVTNSNIIKLAAPISLSLMIPQISFLANTAFLGRLGEQELGVNGISGIFYLVLSMIGYGLSNGVQVMLARRAGEGDSVGLAKTFVNGIVLSVGLSLTLILLSLWLAPIIFGQSLHDTNNVVLSIKFLYRRAWGLPFLMLTQLVNVFFISTGRSKYLIIGSLTSASLNVLFDYALIFGNWGFQPMGLMGAATASVLGEVGYCLMMYSIFYIKGLHRQYPINIAKYFDPALALHTLKIGSPLIMQYLFSIGGWQVFFIYVEHLGQRELATSQILRSVFGVVGIVTWAFASTCNTMVSNIIGQQKHNEVLPLIAKVVKLSFGLTLIICSVLLLFPDTFISLYRSEPGLVAFARPSLRVIVLATLIMSVSTVIFNGVVGTGNTLVNLAIEVTCVGIYLVYCYYVIELKRMPLHWAWGSEFVYWISLLVVCFAYLRSGRWRGKLV